MSATGMDLQNLLTRFGLERFRPGQEEVIQSVLAGHDCLCIMPTGGGKSLCYQLPAVARSGVTLVVSPLIALMKDQVDAMSTMGISATFINSTLTGSEQRLRLQQMAAGKFDLVYIAPERIRNPQFLEHVRQFHVQLLAVDEAHCISEWGHDFRPDYARLGRLREQLGQPQTIALTATATAAVRQDVIEHLRLKEPKIFISGFARPNLRFEVAQVYGAAEKNERLLELIRECPGAGIVYASTRKGCEEVAELLENELQRPVGLYHAGLESEQRRQVQEDFMRGDVEIIVATNAFGMGINKLNLRFVVHYNMPGSLEAYYQEAGRAGRDGLPARCLLLFSFSDRYIHEFFIDNAYPPPETVDSVYRLLRGQRSDPIEITQQEIKDRLALSIGTEGISACEKILEKCGAIKRLDSQQNLPTLVDLLPREAGVRRKVLQALESIVGPQRFDRVSFPLPRLIAMTGLDKEAVARALRELSKLADFDYVPPFRGRAIHLLKPETPFEGLEIDFAELDRRKALELEKLECVIRYARHHGCRQAVILEYFGETSGAPCGSCDNCGGQWTTSHGAGREAHSPLELQSVRIALSGVARSGGRFGKQIVAQMLTGSKSAKLRKYHLDRLSTFGLLPSLTQQEVLQLLDELQRQSLLMQSEVERFRPVVQLTRLGAEVMRQRADLPQPLGLPAILLAKLAGDAAAANRNEQAETVDSSQAIPERNVDPDEVSSHPDFYWSWRILSQGFRPRECAAIRRLPLESVYQHAAEAQRQGYEIYESWLFTAQELEDLSGELDGEAAVAEESEPAALRMAQRDALAAIRGRARISSVPPGS
jgi:ATP-dependent DNA helicase RecQ